MAHPTLNRYLVLQKALDTDVLRALQVSAAKVEDELRRLSSSQRVGALVRTQQLLLSQQAIQAEMSRYWTQMGELTKAAMATSAAAGAETMLDRELLSRVFGEVDLDYLTRSARASAEQALSTARERVSGTSYIPLAESVYDNDALTSGKIDDLVNSALVRGASAAELAADVRDFVNPNTPGGVRYASMRLARTELNNAFHAAQVRQAQKDPWTMTVKWWLSGSHPRPDECNEYADGVHFTGGEAGHFRPAEVPAKPHPNCLCFTTPETVDRDEFIRRFETGDYDDYLDEQFPGISPREVRGARVATSGLPQPPRLEGVKYGDPGYLWGDAGRAARQEYAKHSDEAARLAGLVDTWTDIGLPSQMRAARASIESGEWDDVFDNIAKSAANTETLYRGMVLDADVVSALKAGDTMDLRKLGSFTENRAHTSDFLWGDKAGHVVLELPPGSAPAVNISGISNSPSEFEWFVTGHLQITDVVREGDITRLVVKWKSQ